MNRPVPYSARYHTKSRPSFPPRMAEAFYEQLNEYPGVIDPGLANGVRDVQLERAVEILRSASVLESVKGSGPANDNNSNARK